MTHSDRRRRGPSVFSTLHNPNGMQIFCVTFTFCSIVVVQKCGNNMENSRFSIIAFSCWVVCRSSMTNWLTWNPTARNKTTWQYRVVVPRPVRQWRGTLFSPWSHYVSPHQERHIAFVLSVCLSVCLSQILCTELSQNYWANFDETWSGYPLGMYQELIRCWTMWPNFQGHQGSKGH